MDALVTYFDQGMGMTAVPHLFAAGNSVWDSVSGYSSGSHSLSMKEWKRSLEFIFSLLCLTCSLGLFIFYSLAHRQMRKENKHLLRKRSLWTTDQVNACVLPLGIGMLFAVIFYLFR
jgi:Trk-type K+ transport system membrane component